MVTAFEQRTVGVRGRRPLPAPVPRSPFVGFRFLPDVIVLAVGWYLRFGLPYRDCAVLNVGSRAEGQKLLLGPVEPGRHQGGPMLEPTGASKHWK